ncbi:MAG: hypothetical protein KF846_16405 [Cyclobacteriaceae bacterium]|nr:hypothetical protein [Cyclobacteriaceae bacterium]
MSEKLSEVVLILIGSTLITLILAILIILAVFIGQRRKFRHRKEMIELKSNYDKEVLRTQLETQTQTFETISQELHDNVGNLISMAMVHLKTPALQGDRQQFNEIHKLLDEAMNILRDISRSINPDNIHRRGLVQSIRNELERLRKSKSFKVAYKSDGVEFDIDSQKQIILFRIVQETINNIIKHSGADTVSVTLSFNAPSFSIVIQDNGRGFLHQPDQGDYLNHSGLQNMMKRARMIGGELTIDSALDCGTKVCIAYMESKDEQSKNTINMVYEHSR